MRRRVYVAGPISKGDLAANIRLGVDAGLALLAAGFAPMIPQLSAFIPSEQTATVGTTRYEDWLETDFAWIEAADALIRLPGESAGADREVTYARARGIPVYDGLEAFLGAHAS